MIFKRIISLTLAFLLATTSVNAKSLRDVWLHDGAGNAITSIDSNLCVINKDYYFAVKQGLVSGSRIVSKFGSGNVSTTLVPISSALVYQTPTTATSLEIVSSSANDAAAGTGAQELTLIGLNSSWAEVTQTKEFNGTTAVTIDTDLIRLYRAYVSRSGTYATATAGSHAGTITVRVTGAGATWATVGTSPFPFGQSQIGCYTVPIGKTAYVITKNIYAEGGKTADVYFFQRPFADDVTTPYTGVMRVVEREVGVAGGHSANIIAKGPFVGPCDVGFMGVVSSGSDIISVEFDILEITN